MAYKGATVGGQFILHKRLGSGSFGDVYQSTDMRDGAQYAVKLEKNSNRSDIAKEAKLLQELAGGDGIPAIKFLELKATPQAMVFELLGLDLEHYCSECGRKVHVRKMNEIGSQMVERLEYLHSKNYLHRDIKPANFMIDQRREKIYMCDYGLVKLWRDPVTQEHNPYKEKGRNALTGTARYASINAHRGREQSRRDDLEACMYVVIYLENGTLPWQKGRNRPEDGDEKYAYIRRSKEETPSKELCKNLPDGYVVLMNYAKQLEYFEDPDYSIFYKTFEEMNTEVDSHIDAELKNLRMFDAEPESFPRLETFFNYINGIPQRLNSSVMSSVENTLQFDDDGDVENNRGTSVMDKGMDELFWEDLLWIIERGQYHMIGLRRYLTTYCTETYKMWISGEYISERKRRKKEKKEKQAKQ